MSEDRTRFTPVRGIEADILEMPYHEGYLYFAVDTKKIFLDSNDQGKIPMGSGGSATAGSGIIIGNRQITVEEENQGVVEFTTAHLNINFLPSIDAIILNVPDGCFYRVTSIGKNSIIATRLTVAGGGGGSGSGVTLTLEPVRGIKAGQTFVYKQSSEMEFIGSVDNGDTSLIYTVIVTNTFAGKETSRTYGPFILDINQHFIFDVGSVLPLGSNVVKVSVSSDNAGTYVTKQFSLLNCVEMYLQPSENFNPLKENVGSFNFNCIPVGENLTKKVSIYIDDVLHNELTKDNITDKNTEQTFTIPALSHGMHTITAILTCAESAAQTSLSYNICSIEPGVTTPVIWYNNNVPTSIVNHDTLIIEYMVYNPEGTINQETHYYINGAEIATSPLYVNFSRTTWLKWRVLGYTIGENTLVLKSGTTELPINISVAVDTKRNLEIVDSGLHVNLSAIGRSNAENSQSRETWTSVSQFDGSTTSVNFHNFNWYNNGWITDDDGETCLRISNGASIDIPLTEVLNSRRLQESLAFEFVFRVRNVEHYGTLINTETTDTESEVATVTKTVSSTEGVWGSYYKNSVGFCLGTQEAFFKTKNALVSGRYKEDELVHLTFVIEAAGANSNTNKLIYIYINGVNSGITKYNTTTDSLQANCNTLQINSQYCDIDLYNLRVYKINLNAQYVIQNYLADMNDASLYDMNENIVTYSNGVPYIQYLKMLEYNAEQVEKANPDGLLMPYMLVETVTNDDQMPYYKADVPPWKINIDFVNPQLDYLYENNLIDSDMLTNYGYASADELYALSAPSFHIDGGEINVQGTSSQGYPIRNFKIKLKNGTNWNYKLLKDADNKIIRVDKGGTTSNGYKVGKKFHFAGNIGENKFTLKADYMDSSSVHNTGFANLVGTMYTKHPLEDYGRNKEDVKNNRTSVYGFPFLMFQKLHTGTGDAQYKFLGRYNWNIDKGCDDTFGFADWGDDSYIDVTSLVNADNFNPKKLYILEEDTYKSVADTVGTDEIATYDPSLTYYRCDEGGDSYALNPDYDPMDPYSRRFYPWSRAAECWEMQNNQGGRCSFKKGNFSELASSGLISVLDDYEYRYHADADSIDNCLHKDQAKKDGLDFTGATNEEVNNYMLKKLSRFEKLVEWVASTNEATATGAVLDTPINYGGVTYTQDTGAYRLAKFKYEFDKWLDKEYCLVYWIMTELLLCYDSRGKNLMMATWGPHEYGGNDIWYPIFYDIDTQLGVNNSGVPYWDYYEEASDNGTFSTADSVLWNNLWKVFSQEIMAKFNTLTGKELSIENIIGAYSFDPFINRSMAMSGKRPIITINVDEYQKYIAPSISGYVDTSNTTKYSDAWYYCLQGTRELQRQMFLRNRFNYISSKWRSGNYSVEKTKSAIQIRFDANDYPNTSDKYLNTENPANFFSKAEKVASAGRITINSQENYNNVKARLIANGKEGKIYIKTIDGFIEDESNTYDGSKVDDYYVKNDLEYAAYPHPLDFVWDFNVTPYLKQYVSNVWDDTQLPAVYASDGETVTIPIPEYKFNDVMNTANYPQQLVYFGGEEYISSLGDLSKKYIDQFFASGAKRLKDLLIGSDVEGYWNNMMNTNSFKPDDAATITIDGVTKTNPNAKTLLEKVVLTNLTGLTDTLDFSGSEKLKELRALGTNVSSFILADGVQIAKLHLPNTVTNLILKEPTSLTGILTSPAPTVTEVTTYDPITVTENNYDPSIHYINTLDGYKVCNDAEYFTSNEHSLDYPDFIEDYGLSYNETRGYYIKNVRSESVYPTGLYIQGLTDLTEVTSESVTSLDTINIVGGNMGYDSYSLLERVASIKSQMIENPNLNTDKYDKHLAVNLEKVNWTPYRQVAPGEVPVSDSIYVLRNDHDVFVEYNKITGTEEYPRWKLNVLDGKVYEFLTETYDNSNNKIKDLHLLDIFINDYITAKEVWDMLEQKSQFNSDVYNFFESTDSYAQGPTLANLSGTIFINNENGNAIDEARIKNYYQYYYPKLDIQVANTTPALVAKFIEIDDSTGAEKIWDIKKYSQTSTSTYTPPTYPELSDVLASKLDYDFRGWSATYHTQAEIDAMTETEVANLILTDASDLLFANTADNVVKLYAVYTLHSYNITFKYPDDSIIEIKKVPTISYIPIPSTIPHLDDGDLPLLSSYVFKGYGRDPNSNVLVPLSDDNKYIKIKPGNDLTLYALFDEVDNIHNYPTNEKYFNIDSNGLISVVSGIKLSGKVVIPQSINGIPVAGIQGSEGTSHLDRLGHGFYDQKEITHIFLEKPDEITSFTIGPVGCGFNTTGGDYSLNKLRYIELPKQGNVTIGSGGFRYAYNLFNGNDITEELTREFFSRIKILESQAFINCVYAFKYGIYIPNNITLINGTVFNGCAAFNPTDIVIGSPEGHVNIEDNRFAGENNFGLGGSGLGNTYRNITIYTNNSIDEWKSFFDTPTMFKSNNGGTFTAAHPNANWNVVNN